MAASSERGNRRWLQLPVCTLLRAGRSEQETCETIARMAHCIWLEEDGTFCDKPLPADEKFCLHHADGTLPVRELSDIWTRLEGMYFDRTGAEINMLQWGDLRQNMEYKHLALSRPKNRFIVSTVWLGVNHRYGNGPPIIFESMACGLGRRGQWTDGDLYMVRYCTEREAFRGHSDICRMIHSGWKGPR